MSKSDGWLATAGATLIALVVLINLAWISLVAWGLFELVTWVTSK